MWRKKHDQNELREIYKELNRPTRISEMPHRIELCQKALALVSREKQPELWGKLQDDLGSSLVETPMGPRAENIEQAIQHFEKALEVRTREADPKRWAMTQNNLATAYRDRICGKRAKNIEQAIEHYQQALKERTREALPKEWAMTQINLAGAYYKRIQGERAENLEQAIHHSHQALKVFTRGHLQDASHDWAQARNTLGEVYRVRLSGSRMRNIERAIYHFCQVLQVHFRLGTFPEVWAMTQNNLGNAYLARIGGDRAENVEEAIRCYQRALEVRTHESDPERWAITQYNLGNAYRYRIRWDQTENIEEAIHHFQQALKVRTSESFPADYAQTQNHLGSAYLARIRGEREMNIEQAIQHCQQALEVYTEQTDPEDWAQTLNNLGNAYLARIGGNRAENIEQAIRCYRQALNVRTREAFPEDWAQTLTNLAGAERLRASEESEHAIQHLQQTLDVYTRESFPKDWAGTQNNLAIAYTERIRGERDENIGQAILHYQQAMDVYTREAFPDHCLKTARALGNLAFEQQRWELARNAYETAFGAQDVLMAATFTRAGKQLELSEVQHLPSRAAHALVQGNQVERAVEVLEQGRAQLLRESLERRRKDLEQLPALGFEHLYEDYIQAMQKYNDLQKSAGTSEDLRPGDWISQMEQALEKVRAATAAIREQAGGSHPQYRFFLQALPLVEIQEQARRRPLVYLSVTSAGGLALVVTGKGVQAIMLPELNQASLQKQIWRPSDDEIDRINTHLKQGEITPEDIQAVSGGYFSAYALWSLIPSLRNIPEESKRKVFQAWQEALDQTTRWLWDMAIGELISVLQKHSQSVTLIPAGQLALLPLQAAWTEDTSKPTGRRYALDEMNISYAPSAHALWQASLAAGRPAERLMVVDNPDGTLFFSDDEVQAALDVFKPATHLPGKRAIVEVVREEMQKAHILHFSTHGRAGWEKAEQAQLKLADGDLTLPDIFELDLNQARLAVLSACETGVPGLELIDEMIGLPAGMMQAGVPGVVGSLWSVNDMSTAMLMARFYSLWRKEGYPPQEALRQAQIWLRDSTTEQKMELFDETVHMNKETAQAFYEYIGWDDPDAREFASPYFWAAFTYTGV